MRIISGKYKGRRVSVPPRFKARPTTDFAREGLFNVLGNSWDFEDLAVLELFAGTGSVGFEFASRGAGRVDMVELDAKTIGFLEQTAEKLGEDRVMVFRSDAMEFIRHTPVSYDIVFADPPYDLRIIPEIPGKVLDSGILVPGGWFILEHGKSQIFSKHMHFLESRKYGSVHFSIFTILSS